MHVARLSEDRAQGLKERLAKVLGQVRAAVEDWKPMLARLDRAISDFRYAPVPLDKDAVTEAIAFLEWLRDDNFVFLGMREFQYIGGEATGTLERTDEPGLGILADPDVLVLRRGNEAVTTTPEIRAFLHGPEPLIVTKANAKSVVHRRIYLDYIGVKTYDKKGKLNGELRIVGLFTSTAYTRSVMKIPYLRSKVEDGDRQVGLQPERPFRQGADQRRRILSARRAVPDRGADRCASMPRRSWRLRERPRVRALVRVDQFDRFVSVLVFVPRDRYDSRVRERIGDYLKTAFDGRLSAYYPAFPEGSLARVHFIIGRSGGKTPKVEQTEIRGRPPRHRADLGGCARRSGRQRRCRCQAHRRRRALPGELPRQLHGGRGAADAGRIAGLDAENAIAIDYYRHAGQGPSQAALKIYHFGAPVALVPARAGAREHGLPRHQRAHLRGRRRRGDKVFIHDMELENAFQKPIALDDGGKLVEDVSPLRVARHRRQ